MKLFPCKVHLVNYILGIFSVILVLALLIYRLASRGIPKKPTEITCFAGIVSTLCYFFSVVVYYGSSVSDLGEFLPDTLICSVARNAKHETSVLVMAIFLIWSRQRVIASRVVDTGGLVQGSPVINVITIVSILNLIITPIVAESFYGSGSDYWELSDSDVDQCHFCETKKILLTPGYVACSVIVGAGALFSIVGFQIYFAFNIFKAMRAAGKVLSNKDGGGHLNRLTRRSQNLALLIAFQTIVGMSLFALPSQYSALAEEVVFLLFALSFFYEQFMTNTAANKKSQQDPTKVATMTSFNSTSSAAK